MPLITITSDTFIGDSFVKWKAYKYSDCIVNRFIAEEWHKIASDVFSEEELDSLLTDYPNVIQGFVLYENNKNKPIAFCYILRENKRRRVISIHGGGWGNSMSLSLLYYRGLILMIQYLLHQGFRIRTSCLCTNHRAYRFLRSLGFVKYCSARGYFYMWINKKRLQCSSIYAYLKIKE